MAKRSLLRRSNIEDFKAWLQEDGWQIEKTKGIYEVVRAYVRDRRREARAAQAGVKKIAKEEATKVIDTRKPIGKFYLTQGRTIVGIDNTTGDAWTEEFKSFETLYQKTKQGRKDR